MRRFNRNAAGRATGEQFFQTLLWGIQYEDADIHHSRNILSYCVIGDDYYATADGATIMLWKPHNIVTTVNLPGRALFYLPKLSQVVASVQGSHMLHFIGSKAPYQLRIHPLHFSDHSISSFFYFTKTSTLVSAGEGLLFTRVMIPPYFKYADPMPETLQFEKLCSFYEDINFDDNKPYFVENAGIVIVNVQNDIHILTSNGTEVQIIRNLVGNNIITSISLLSEINSLVAGTESGQVTILKFELPNPFVPNAPPDSLRNITTFNVSESQILMSELFDRNFLVSVDKEKKISVFSTKQGKKLQNIKCKYDVNGGFFVYNRLVLFSQTVLSLFKCSLYLSHFCDVNCDAFDVTRSVSETRSARFVCYLKNFCVNLVSTREGRPILGFTTSINAPCIRNVCYLRDVEIDGFYTSRRMLDDTFVCQLDHGLSSFFEFDKIDKTLLPTKGDMFYPTVKGFEIAWMPTTIIETPLLSTFINFFDVGDGHICGIIESGVVFIYSSVSKKLIDSFSINEDQIICAIYSFSHKLLVVSAVNKLFTYNIKTKRIVSSVNDCLISALLMSDENTLFCGCANGFVEIRNFPSLQVKLNSQFYHAFHTEDGHRTPIQTTFLSTRQIYDYPSAVKKLDICPRREIILSLSVYGEIFLWEKTGKPVIRINIPFGVSSACFFDGTGAILISTLGILFKIEWNILFKKQLLPIHTPLDDYDLRFDSFDIRKTTKRDPPAIKPVTKYLKDQFLEDSFLTNNENEFFENLIVDLDVLPKRHFAPIRKEENVEIAMKSFMPARNIDDIIQKEKYEEEKRNRKSPKQKKIQVKSRKNNFSITQPPVTKSKATANKYEGFYNRTDNDSTSISSGSPKKLKKKSKKSSAKTFSKTSSVKLSKKSKKLSSKANTAVLDSISSYDRLNSSKSGRNKSSDNSLVKSKTHYDIAKFDLSSINELKTPFQSFSIPARDTKAQNDIHFEPKPPSEPKPQKINKVSSDINNENQNQKSSKTEEDENESHNKEEDISIIKPEIERDTKEKSQKSKENESQRKEPEVIINFPKNTNLLHQQAVNEQIDENDNENEIKNENEDEYSEKFLFEDGRQQNIENGEPDIETPNIANDNQNLHKIREPDPTSFKIVRHKIKNKSSSFLTQPDAFNDEGYYNENFEQLKDYDVAGNPENETEILHIENHNDEMSYRSKYLRNFNRVRRKDDEMFTNFRIDGFNQPFGGFSIKEKNGMAGIGSNAPLVQVESAGERKMQKTRGVFVRKVPKQVKMAPKAYKSGGLFKTVNEENDITMRISNYY
ncbi:hypothetical protein TRFO_03168 [Tritrichomonas foetus]|uniref:Uncharacterized protein n=1 Tax=Tritrichomonas foetus TaxID=1144522 RepID=A0A1J4KX51_9EUKA|nr:hypothetical protein TRFO_03168 [Tritrichomonas foetus]|eukprot:OHT14133.1 hypothetical protein TRFO_03168 [Tritrichomonas foetus]